MVGGKVKGQGRGKEEGKERKRHCPLDEMGNAEDATDGVR